MKRFNKILKGLCTAAVGMVCILSIGTMAKANTKATAVEVPMDGMAEGSLDDSSSATTQMWYKFTVPSDIGNQYVTFSLTNYGEDYYNQVRFKVQTVGGEEISSNGVGVTGMNSAQFRIEGSKSVYEHEKYLIPGQTYYVYVTLDHTWAEKSKFEVSLGSTPEDNWGSLEKAETLNINSNLERKLEDRDDVDSFAFTLPQDGKKYKLTLKSGDDVAIEVLNEAGVKEEEDAYTSSTSYEFIGDGKKHYVTIEGSHLIARTTSYTLALSEEVPAPTAKPTAAPTAKPTIAPTANPTVTPTNNSSGNKDNSPSGSDNVNTVPSPSSAENSSNISTTNKTNITNVTNTNTTNTRTFEIAKIMKVTAKSSKKSVFLRWKKNAKASGYKIYRSTKKKSGFKCIKTLKGNKKTFYTDKKVVRKKTYYYVIKCYKQIGKKVECSKPSSVKKVKVK